MRSLASAVAADEEGGNGRFRSGRYGLCHSPQQIEAGLISPVQIFQQDEQRLLLAGAAQQVGEGEVEAGAGSFGLQWRRRGNGAV